ITGLSSLYVGKLEEAGVTTIDRLTLCTESDLLKIYQFGPQRIGIIRNQLASWGLPLRTVSVWEMPRDQLLRAPVLILPPVSFHPWQFSFFDKLGIQTVQDLVLRSKADLLAACGSNGWNPKAIKQLEGHLHPLNLSLRE
ncbi:MAG: hypothetical protein HY537_07070, partial [Deltaproteobacteria bacterium]|nr:hypothetical protein [Deltaproteobacteria bacterium]